MRKIKYWVIAIVIMGLSLFFSVNRFERAHQLKNALSILIKGDSEVTTLKTASGLKFSIYGHKKDKPSPVIFNFSGIATQTLSSPDYNLIGHLLWHHGFISVSLNLPCHKDIEETTTIHPLKCWSDRIEDGSDLVKEFNPLVKEVLEYLIEEGYADPKNISIAGTSRGGFMALHLAAREARFKSIILFSPVTDLNSLDEFKLNKKSVNVDNFDLVKIITQLKGHPVWLTIGNNDQRVNTDKAIEFTRKLTMVQSGQTKIVPVDLSVLASDGHTVPKEAHKKAAEWLLENF